MDKTFPCLTCKQEIRLERKQDNSGWNKYNLDNSPHVHEKKQQQQGSSSRTYQRVEELSKQVSDLKATVNILISQIQMLSSEIVVKANK
jgi:hypothetical protein